MQIMLMTGWERFSLPCALPFNHRCTHALFSLTHLLSEQKWQALQVLSIAFSFISFINLLVLLSNTLFLLVFLSPRLFLFTVSTSSPSLFLFHIFSAFSFFMKLSQLFFSFLSIIFFPKVLSFFFFLF